ncbi:MAG: hypothetical protein HND47_24705 [Chloroflexi bacterium]|nr:hypothetical protein [Chloroflexota bacterium]
MIADIIFYVFKKDKKIASFLAGGLPQLWIVYSVVFFGKMVGMPGVENTEKTLLNWPLLTGAVILGGLGGLVGLYLFNRVKDTPAGSRIMQQNEKLD